jgi:glycyl-tRNA synthetase
LCRMLFFLECVKRIKDVCSSTPLNEESDAMADEASVMEKIVSLCKRRGFVYPASEIYGGLNGFWDYGPPGVLLKNNIRDSWWRNMVECPPVGSDGHPLDMVGLDSSIIQNPKTWVASGHVGGFSDPMVDDKETQGRFRADHLMGVYLSEPELNAGEADAIIQDRSRLIDPTLVPDLTVIATSAGEAAGILAEDKKLRKTFGLNVFEVVGRVTGDQAWARVDYKGHEKTACIRKIEAKVLENAPERVPSPFTGKPGSLTAPRQFNLMLLTEIGAVDPVEAYLRPETAQGIFLNYKNIIDTTRVKVPFGVAQIGKSFRNEVTPRNFIFRSREFEQMEMEWFCHPDEARTWYEFWKSERMRWWRSLGVKEENLKLRDHAQDELSHYSKMTVDIEYKYPFTAPDFGELEGIAHRGEFDLTQHQKHSGQKLDYFDQELQLKLKEQGASAEEIKAKSRYIPNVIEPASGLTRAVLVLLCEGFIEDANRPSGVYMKFDPKMAPVKAGIFPLVNKDGMPEVAERLYMSLRTKFMCEYDPKQSIGKRYARMDEIGTPYCITVDGDTLKDQTVTIRERDTLQQERVGIDKVKEYLTDRLLK